MQILHNHARWYVMRPDGSCVSCAVEPKDFILGMVAIRSDGLVMFVDMLAIDDFCKSFLTEIGQRDWIVSVALST